MTTSTCEIFASRASLIKIKIAEYSSVKPRDPTTHNRFASHYTPWFCSSSNLSKAQHWCRWVGYLLSEKTVVEILEAGPWGKDWQLTLPMLDTLQKNVKDILLVYIYIDIIF